MANSISKGKLRVLRSRSTGFILIGVMGFLIAGFVFEPAIASIPNILPQSNPDEFTIPFITPEEQQMNKEILQEIKDVTVKPEVEIDPELMQSNLDCIKLLQDASSGASQTIVTNSTLNDCQNIQQQVIEQTQQQTQEMINTLTENIIVPDPTVPPVQTSSSNPLTQICDQHPDFIICGKTTSLQLITKVVKQDSNGNQKTVETTTVIPQLAFFGEGVTDYRNGLLQFELAVKGDPNFTYKVNGKVDLLIGQQSIFLEPISVMVDGTADQDGKVKFSFVSPTGGLSDILLFKFSDYINSFPDATTSQVRLHLVQLDIAGQENQNFALTDKDVFTMNIERDETKVLITNEQGFTSLVYPSDSRLIVSTIAGKSAPYSEGYSSYTTYKSDFMGNGRGCSPFYVQSSGSYAGVGTKTYPVPAPSISGVSITDQNNNVLASVQGGIGTVLDFTALTRDQSYTLKVNSPAITSSPLVYGKSQETKSFTCQQSATANLISTSTSSGSSAPCGTYSIYSGSVLNPSNPLTLGAISCNIP